MRDVCDSFPADVHFLRFQTASSSVYARLDPCAVTPSGDWRNRPGETIDESENRNGGDERLTVPADDLLVRVSRQTCECLAGVDDGVVPFPRVDDEKRAACVQTRQYTVPECRWCTRSRRVKGTLTSIDGTNLDFWVGTSGDPRQHSEQVEPAARVQSLPIRRTCSLVGRERESQRGGVVRDLGGRCGRRGCEGRVAGRRQLERVAVGVDRDDGGAIEVVDGAFDGRTGAERGSRGSLPLRRRLGRHGTHGRGYCPRIVRARWTHSSVVGPRDVALLSPSVGEIQPRNR